MKTAMPIFNVEEIKELLNAFNTSKATELEIRGIDGERVIFKQNTGPSLTADTSEQTAAVSHAAVSTIPQAVSSDMPASEPVIKGAPVNSPMVGVFYAASAPGAEPYVRIGSRVHKGDVLCLIEAMKLMNEVTADTDGEIVEICVENGQVVEYGQPLFMIK